ncbi:YigZ family protein [Pedobacter psychrophilus]|uniref:YigZ family protein n=1 Tax=Pedobacter psychrophilus TaxID=1826909 RepID=A0A179DEX0_9SPHI|nr:YigZ family protein [Pedobacter psychrophilus]OAQ39596.1 YigZ family protein [Pedobacter psychrophilus]
MLFNDVYKTISKPSEGIFKDKASKFLAFAYPFVQEQDLKNIIAHLKTEHSKARHFCFAYRLTPDRNVFRINDDGEPSGTAGRPILNILLSTDLTNILVIVVRYFGGTLLGVPGLINAYKKATEDAITQAIIIEKTVQDIYQLSFDYLQMNDVMKLVKDDHLEIIDQNFDLNCDMKIAINQSGLNKIIDKLEKIEALKSTYLYTI